MFSGVLKKMITEYGLSIGYYLDFENDFVAMHQYLDHTIKLEMTGYECLACSSSQSVGRMRSRLLRCLALEKNKSR